MVAQGAIAFRRPAGKRRLPGGWRSHTITVRRNKPRGIFPEIYGLSCLQRRGLSPIAPAHTHGFLGRPGPDLPMAVHGVRCEVSRTEPAEQRLDNRALRHLRKPRLETDLRGTCRRLSGAVMAGNGSSRISLRALPVQVLFVAPAA